MGGSPLGGSHCVACAAPISERDVPECPARGEVAIPAAGGAGDAARRDGCDSVTNTR